MPPVGRQNNSCDLAGRATREPLRPAHVRTFVQTEAVCSVVPYETGRRAKIPGNGGKREGPRLFYTLPVWVSNICAARVYFEGIRAWPQQGRLALSGSPSYDAFLFFFLLILELAGCRGGCTRAVGRPSQGADIKHRHLLFIGALLESFSAKAAPHTLKRTGCLF